MKKSIIKALANLEKAMEEKKSSASSNEAEYEPSQRQEPNYKHGRLDIKPFPIEYPYR